MNTQNIYNNKDINTKINLDTNSSTKIKICGLTSPAEARYLNDSRIAGYVFDAIEPGSGKTFDWKLVDNIPRDEKLLLLAGGLNPDNVRMAIEAVHPDGVDVSSGVENDDKAGKNPEKIHDFVAAVKS